MTRKLTTVGLILALALSTTALAADPFFPKVTDLPAFTDITPTPTPGGAWYDYQSVKTTVEAGLMKGTGTDFNPGGDITLAEVATIAARINEKTTGYAIPQQEAGQAWYEGALAVMAHIGVDVGKDALAKATRSDLVRILSAVLPDNMMVAINTIATLPDTKDAAVLRFYNAGILTGRDIYGTFAGADPLRRSEVCAMLARVINPDLRMILNLAYSPSALNAA